LFHWALFVVSGLESPRRMAMEGKTYRSPVRKLLSFFVRSRDQWKTKCRDGKVIMKRLTNRVQKLKKSRNNWRERAKQQQEELGRLRQELAAQKTAVA
jgi:hypothetical protein